MHLFPRLLSGGGTQDSGPYCVHWRGWYPTVYLNTLPCMKDGEGGGGGGCVWVEGICEGRWRGRGWGRGM